MGNYTLSVAGAPTGAFPVSSGALPDFNPMRPTLLTLCCREWGAHRAKLVVAVSRRLRVWMLGLGVLGAMTGMAQAAPPVDAPMADPAVAALRAADLSNTLLPKLAEYRDAVSNTTSDLVMNAMGFLGVPYKRGGSSEATGFDCSGFVRSVYEKTLGTVLPRRAAEQAASTTLIAKEELKPGDLVFFNTMRRTFSHVGIYIGEGQFIHSPRAGGRVRIESMREAYWSKRFHGARRVQTAAPAAGLPAPTGDRPSVP